METKYDNSLVQKSQSVKTWQAKTDVEELSFGMN